MPANLLFNLPPKALFVMEDILNSRMEAGVRPFFSQALVNSLKGFETFFGDALASADRIRSAICQKVCPQACGDVREHKHLRRDIGVLVHSHSFRGRFAPTTMAELSAAGNGGGQGSAARAPKGAVA